MKLGDIKRMVSSAHEKIGCSVGVTAYNEEGNIAHLLEALLDQHLHDVEIAEIIVVASACTDRTVPIVREYLQRDPRIRLIEQERREGKTSAVNLFLAAAQSAICVLESGDTLPAKGSIDARVSSQTLARRARPMAGATFWSTAGSNSNSSISMPGRTTGSMNASSTIQPTTSARPSARRSTFTSCSTG